MATDAIIFLERLRCTRESDVAGGSEPYIWPVLLWIDDDTLMTKSLVGVAAPAARDARVVLKKNMRAGQTVSIPSSVGILRNRFEDGLTIRRLIFTIALWEADETPETAVRAGFHAFSSELRAAIADNLFALSQANGEEQDRIIATIESRVSTRVSSAIEDSLTGWQKVRVLIGTLNLDDIIDSGFEIFSDISPATITLAFGTDTANFYEIQGRLLVRPVRVERCQIQVDAVNAAQSVVDDIDTEIKVLQKELNGAYGSERENFLISEIKRLREEELPSAIAALYDARRSLSLCRLRVKNEKELPPMEEQVPN